MSKLFALVIVGLSVGSVYALVAMGVVLTYRVSRVVNLAHSGIGIFATYVFHFGLVEGLGLPVWLAFCLAVVTGAVLAVIVERVFVAPVREGGILVTAIMTIGLLLVLVELTVQLWGYEQPVVDSVFPDRPIALGGIGVTLHQLGIAGVVLLLGVGLYLVLERTRYGAIIEAIAEDPGAARIVGLPVRAVTTATWAAGGATAALAGMLYIHMSVLDQVGLTFVFISSLVGAVIGGFSHLGLTMAGSLGAGVLLALVQGYADVPGFADLATFVVLVAALVALRGRQAGLESVSEF